MFAQIIKAVVTFLVGKHGASDIHLWCSKARREVCRTHADYTHSNSKPCQHNDTLTYSMWYCCGHGGRI